jgi:hypothetical protein
LRIVNEDSEKNSNFPVNAMIVKKMMLFLMVEILIGLFVENSNEELRRTTVILSSS